MAMTREDILRAIHAVGKNDRHFQSREVRKNLGVDPSDRNTSARIHNQIKSLQRDGLIEEIPSSRKRHKYYRIKSEGWISPVSGASSGSVAGKQAVRVPDRLSRMESSLRELEQLIEAVDQKVDRLLSIWT